MRWISFCLSLIFLFFFIIGDNMMADDLTVLKGPDLGQKAPGEEAELFAPNVISYVVHCSPSISPDNKEMFIDTMDEGGKYYQMIDGIWSLQENLPFDIPGACNGIFISPSGKKIFLLVWKDGQEDFYFSEKKAKDWSRLQLLGKDIKTSASTWQFASSKYENLYFSFEGKIVISQFKGGHHIKAIPLKLEDGKDMTGGTPFIAPDESYLIFNRGDGKDSDLYISYSLRSNKWTEPVDLGSNINANDKMDLCPNISPDGKYLFFISRRNGPEFQIFWADAGFIEKLEPGE